MEDIILYKITDKAIEIAKIGDDDECYRPTKCVFPLSYKTMKCGHYEAHRIWKGEHLYTMDLAPGLTKEELVKKGFKVWRGKDNSRILDLAKEILGKNQVKNEYFESESDAELKIKTRETSLEIIESRIIKVERINEEGRIIRTDYFRIHVDENGDSYREKYVPGSDSWTLILRRQ